MFMKLSISVLLAIASAVSPVLSLPAPRPIVVARYNHEGEKNSTDGSTLAVTPGVLHLNDTVAKFPEIGYLFEGNQAFRSAVQNSSNPNLLQDLTTNGQHPEFLFLGCSDSRVNEGTIFSAPPGALFSQRNIGNQFQPIDNNAISVLSYGVSALGVGHVIVMGHYGCGGVQAAMMQPPNETTSYWESSLLTWVNPIRYTWVNSNRTEIFIQRQANLEKGSNFTDTPPEVNDPAFRALVEENVKDSIFNIAISPVMREHWAQYIAQEQAQNGTTTTQQQRRDDHSDTKALKPVYVHGFVYDVASGEVIDLGVSIGPHGPTNQAPPQENVKRAVEQLQHGHAH